MRKFILTTLSCVFFSYSSFAMKNDEDEKIPIYKTQKLLDKYSDSLYEYRDSDPEGIFKAGMMYFGKNDYAKAFEYFFIAAYKGHDMAMHNVGILYEYGRGVDKDLKLAKECYIDAEKKGNKKAKESKNRIIQKENNYIYRLIY